MAEVAETEVNAFTADLREPEPCPELDRADRTAWAFLLPGRWGLEKGSMVNPPAPIPGRGKSAR